MSFSILDSPNQFDRRISGVWGYSQFLQHPYYVIWCASKAAWHHFVFAVMPMLNYSRGPLLAQRLLCFCSYPIEMQWLSCNYPLMKKRCHSRKPSWIPASIKFSHVSNFSSFSPDPSTAWWIFFLYSDSPESLLFSSCLIALESLEYCLLF